MGHKKKKRKQQKHKPPLKKAQVALPPSAFESHRKRLSWWWIVGGALMAVFVVGGITLRILAQTQPGPPMNKVVRVVRPLFHGGMVGPRITITQLYPRRVIVGESAAAHVFLRADSSTDDVPVDSEASMTATSSSVEAVQDQTFNPVSRGAYSSYEYAIKPNVVGSIITTLKVLFRPNASSVDEQSYTFHSIINAIPTPGESFWNLGNISNLCVVVGFLFSIGTYLIDRREKALHRR